VNHATSYWLPKQSARLLVERVDFVSGVGNDRAAGQLFHDLRGVVSDLGVFDFGGQDGAIRLVSIHPGVSVESVRAATGFVLEVADNLVETPEPTAEQQAIIERLDPQNTRSRELA
jgi:acyl CoA:acetate/3-ketoacid CoA transferase beta subunit